MKKIAKKFFILLLLISIIYGCNEIWKTFQYGFRFNQEEVTLLHYREFETIKKIFPRYQGKCQIKVPHTLLGKPVKKLLWTFTGYKQLESVELPDTIEVLGDSSFTNCSKLQNITFPPSLKQIGNYTFAYCSNLTEVRLPASLESIGENAFLGCNNLETIYLSEGTKEIKTKAFYECSSLKKVHIPSSVTFISENVFDETSNIEIITSKGTYAEAYAQKNNISLFIE